MGDYDCSPVWAPQAVEQTQAISWLNGVKSDLNEALFSLGLVLLMLVVFINCSLVVYAHASVGKRAISIAFVHPSVCLSVRRIHSE